MGHRLYLTIRTLTLVWAVGVFVVSAYEFLREKPWIPVRVRSDVPLRSVPASMPSSTEWDARKERLIDVAGNAVEILARGPDGYFVSTYRETVLLPIDEASNALQQGYLPATTEKVLAFDAEDLALRTERRSNTLLMFFAGTPLLAFLPLVLVVASRRWWLWLTGRESVKSTPPPAQPAAERL